MNMPVKIKFISDISCVWCAISLKSLEAAIASVAPDIQVELQFQPFQSNPDMPDGGQKLTEHVGGKYGSSRQACAASRESIRQRGAAVGFTFNLSDQNRIYNTFDAHRLLHWAHLEGRQMALKQALFEAHFTDGKDPGNHDLLVQLATKTGLDAGRARAILASDEYGEEVRQLDAHWRKSGVRSVPTLVFNGRQASIGSQSADIYAQLIRSAAAGGPLTLT